MYDVCKRSSFTTIENWLNDFKKHQSIQEVVVMLVGNKNDLEERRAVSVNEGVEFARSHGMLFMETSAKTAENVEKAFDMLIENVYRCEKSGVEKQKKAEEVEEKGEPPAAGSSKVSVVACG